MDLLNLAAISFPIVIVILTAIGMYKVFVKKKSVTIFYTPFDKIMGQTDVVYHEEQEVKEDETDSGDDKDKYKLKLKGKR
jgi:hypothetical protein